MILTPSLALFNVVLSLILSTAIFSSKTKGSKWLSIMLLCWGAHALFRWGVFNEIHFFMVYLPLLTFPAAFFISSALFLYADRVLFDDKNQKIFRHLIVPAVIFIMHLLFILLYFDNMTVSNIKHQLGLHRIYVIIVRSFLEIYVVILLGITIKNIVMYKRKYKNNFSNDMIKNSRWLFNLVLFNLFVFSGNIVKIINRIVSKKILPPFIAEEIVLLGIILFFIYYIITKPQILPVIITARPKTDSKYAKISLPDTMRKRFAKKIEEYMVKEQAFLDEKLSVSRIAEALNIPRHHVSMTINTEFNKNFYNYVNKFRIEYAEALLKDSEQIEESILMIAYQSGFQSKGSFNKLFKSNYHMTPSEYRKKHVLDVA